MKYTPIPERLTGPCAQPGKLTRFWYDSETYDAEHRPIRKEALAYLPYGYERQTEKTYPVLFLMHGGGGNSNEFFGAKEEDGGIRATALLKPLLDNAIAEKICQPMIVVAPTYLVPGVEEARHHIDIARTLTHRFPQELKNDLLPALSAAFRVKQERWARAFGGFSMGGETTWSVMSECLPEIASYLPLSGDWWELGLKGGKDFPEETADALIRKIAASGVTPADFRVMAFTGDKDIAFDAFDSMIRALKKRADWFTYADTPEDGNLCYCLKENGWHTYDACYEYLALALPHLFR